MFKTQLIFSILLCTSLHAASALASETASQPAATETNKLEVISPSPAAKSADDCPIHKAHKDKCNHKMFNSAKEHNKGCPVLKSDKEKCEHKHGEPCPYHQGDQNHRE